MYFHRSNVGFGNLNSGRNLKQRFIIEALMHTSTLFMKLLRLVKAAEMIYSFFKFCITVFVFLIEYIHLFEWMFVEDIHNTGLLSNALYIIAYEKV